MTDNHEELKSITDSNKKTSNKIVKGATSAELLFIEESSYNFQKAALSRIRVVCPQDNEIYQSIHHRKNDIINIIKSTFYKRKGYAIDIKEVVFSKGSIVIDAYSFDPRGYRDIKQLIEDLLAIAEDVLNMIADFFNSLINNEPVKESTQETATALVVAGGAAVIATTVFAAPVVVTVAIGTALYAACKKWFK